MKILYPLFLKALRDIGISMKKGYWIIILLSLSWGVLAALFTGAFFAISFCDEINPACFTNTYARLLPLLKWIPLILAIEICVLPRILFSLFYKIIEPKLKKKPLPQFNPPPLQPGSSILEVSYQPPEYTISLTHKAVLERKWFVFVDDQPVASSSLKGKVQIPLTPGSHRVFVGFQHDKPFQEQFPRTNRITINLEEGQSKSYQLKRNEKLFLLILLGLLIFFTLFSTQKVWLAPMLNNLPPLP